MQYGFFDDQAKEYVITRPDTPQSWSNYLGSTEYGAIITNNAGGYGFYQSGARGRFMRLRFNSVPMDQPGRYFYLRDRESGDYWSASWQPVGKPIDRYQSTCRHGTAYTVFESRYAGINSEATYFVPLGQTFEYWRLKVTNESDRPREISAFTFCEFTNQWDTYQDRVNLQYSLFIVRGELVDGLLRIAIQDNLTPDSGEFFIHDIARHSWMTLIGASLDGYDTSRDAFLGPYRSYHNPLAVEQGQCTSSNAYGDNACGSLQCNLTLQPGESRTVLVMLGLGDARSVGKRTVAEYGSLERAEVELHRLKNGILPLDREQIQSIAVIGESADQAQIQGGGSAHVSPHYAVSPLEGIRNQAGDSIKVGYEIGCTLHRRPPLVDSAWLTTEDRTQNGLTVQFFADLDLSGEPVQTAVAENVQLIWFGEAVMGIDLEEFSARLSGWFTAPETGRYRFNLMSVGRSRLIVNGNLATDNWAGGSPAEHREQDVELEMEAGQSYPIQIEYSWAGGAQWRTLQLGCLPPVPADPVQRAAALAAQSDVAIVLAGLTDEWESEGYDRADMELHGDQVELIERVAAANPNTIVVLNTGSPVTMEWLDRVPALVQVWYPGQEAGNALADVLFGLVNPSGKLPTTFPKRLQDNPAYLNYPGENGQVLYGEGIFVGYRYYDKKGIEPLFPFGHGLSYTSFSYNNLVLSAARYAPGDEIQVSVDVENRGARAGKEVVQLYVQDAESSLIRPEKELKAFAKVMLEPDQTKTVTFKLGGDDLSFYDPSRKRWVAEPGEFKVLVGSSSQDIRLVGCFALQNDPLERCCE